MSCSFSFSKNGSYRTFEKSGIIQTQKCSQLKIIPLLLKRTVRSNRKKRSTDAWWMSHTIFSIHRIKRPTPIYLYNKSLIIIDEITRQNDHKSTQDEQANGHSRLFTILIQIRYRQHHYKLTIVHSKETDLSKGSSTANACNCNSFHPRCIDSRSSKIVQECMKSTHPT